MIIVRALLETLEEKSKEDIEGEQHEREDDTLAKTAPGAHAILFFLFGFLFG